MCPRGWRNISSGKVSISKARKKQEKKDRRERKLDSRKKALEIAKLVGGKKAEGVVILNISKLSSVSDYLLVCSGLSERQVQTMASAVEEGLKAKGKRPLGVEGKEMGKWVLMDYGDVVVHLFHEPVRARYDIEGLWVDAPPLPIKDEKKKAG
ncbi:MAG: ribosome silencing factor [Thermodesulfobacteriota bacterium]